VVLFPTVDRQLGKIIVGLGIGLLVTAIVLVLTGVLQSTQLSVMAAATATATKTPTKPPTATPSPTATATNTATPTDTPTATATVTATETSTPTATPLPPTATPVPPTATATSPPVLTNTLTLTQTEIATVAVTPTEDISLTAPLTGTITATLVTATPVGTPTPTPTPVPRTVQLPPDLPDYRLAEDHLWFTRAFSNAFDTWGSYYYPYGTNARGQYFWHFGIDIQNPQRTPIIAVGDGKVIHAGPDDIKQLGPWPNFYGQAVVIEHDRQWEGQPVYSLYGHVSEVLVKPGEQVQTGQPIALVGQLGVALGPHLHLEVRLGAGTYYDVRNPDLWVRPDAGFGVIAGRVVDYQDYLVPQQLVTLHRAESAGKFWRQTYTYPDNVVNSDDQLGETFTFSDVPAGKYVVKTFFDGRQLTIPVTVSNQATSFVLLKQDQPPKQPQPAPSPTPSGEEPSALPDVATPESQPQ
jgi:murein DD-endopeptidase MepM/ murein hydrolase activator NlpD